jgi:heat shock protein HslJ
MTLFLLTALACAPLVPAADGTVPAGTVPAATATADGESAMTEMTMYIAPTRVDCTGVAPMQCMQVKFEEDAAYELFYDGIDGFVYVPGYEYELHVQRLARENPPADGSAYLYSLIEVVSQTPAYAGDAFPLEGSEWQLIAFGDEDMVVYQPEAAVITATFSDGQITGNAGCNNYGGDYTVDGAALSLSPLVATRMACVDETVMAAETAYLDALASAGDYAIEGNLLTITYAAGQLTFMAAGSAAE